MVICCNTHYPYQKRYIGNYNYPLVFLLLRVRTCYVYKQEFSENNGGQDSDRCDQHFFSMVKSPACNGRNMIVDLCSPSLCPCYFFLYHHCWRMNSSDGVWVYRAYSMDDGFPGYSVQDLVSGCCDLNSGGPEVAIDVRSASGTVVG